MTQTTNPTTTTTTTKTTIPKSTTVPLTTISTIVPKTTKITTTTIRSTSTETNELAITNSTSTDSSVTTNKAKKIKIKDNDDTITAACASVGGFITIIVVIVMVCIYRRNHSKSASKPASKPGQGVNNDNDDYGLRENVLYIPADSTPIQTNDNWQNTNRISVDIDGNYSTVDLDVTPSVEESTGDYSSIDLIKLAPTESNMNVSTNEKPVIAPKPKQKMTIQDDVYLLCSR